MDAIADASAILAVIFDEPERAAVIRATQKATLSAPECLHVEIGNALIAMTKRGRLEKQDVLPAWRAVQQIPIRTAAVEMESALQLALDQGIYAYDAYYLQCAISHRRPLITLDRKMRAIAESLGLRLLLEN